MNTFRFKQILKTWKWYNGKRFSRRFSVDIGMMNGYGGAGYSPLYYGITNDGKRVRINGHFSFRYDASEKEVVIVKNEVSSIP
jgi:hypothetical protein